MHYKLCSANPGAGALKSAGLGLNADPLIPILWGITMFKITKKKALVAGIATVVIVGGASAALAFWTTSGAGTGSASTGNVVGITVNQTSTVSGLYPNGPAAGLSGDFTNTNSGAVYVHQVTVAIESGWSSNIVDVSQPACTASDFTLVQPTPTNAEVASGSPVGAWGGASIFLKDTATNQDNCKDVSVNLVYTSN
jgi:hypothetical protein